ncbi:zinc-binding dehydrogenase [Arthrobacter sp. JCM 19049]|uniref:zinc-binding dehydrogenase n=1 Tax=Arthrobacter sp. JCM 19049 TaxID=1460643 RepID=UPI000A7F7D66|nr:zinc-binding dehydrogenase [Arthrobacter sp. JCM 19049]
MAALSATIKGAAKVMVVDRHPDRLRLAEQIGAIAVDDSKTDPVQFVLDQTMGLGADRGCECVGYQAHDPQGTEDPVMTLNRLVQSVRFTGGIGVVGVFLPQDPGGPDEMAKQGKVAFDYGLHWLKGQTIGSGQAPVKKYNRRLRDLIAAGKATPSWIVSHDLSLDQAPDATRTSMSATTAGPRSCCTRTAPASRRPELRPADPLPPLQLAGRNSRRPARTGRPPPLTERSRTWQTS